MSRRSKERFAPPVAASLPRFGLESSNGAPADPDRGAGRTGFSGNERQRSDGGSESSRPTAEGKFLFAGEEKLYLRGVTYGTFRPDRDGSGYPAPATVEADFSQMAHNGFNAVRTYTVPPGHLLDAAARHGLRVLIGLPWEQHIAFLDEPGLADAIENRLREGVRAVAGHPAVLGYAVGNEIPGPIVRWHGRRSVERFLRRLYEAAKNEDPEGLVTYVNFPTTEYLQLPFLDFHCFNVYLESDRQLEAYLARLQNVVGDRPLVMAEIGLDSRRNGEDRQAESLEGQVRLAFESGCAGAFVFAWTDEWYRGGYEVEDWDFGLTDRRRQPKRALGAVRRAFEEIPFAADAEWPSVSVVICAHNGAATLRWCLEGVRELDYPDYEVIVVDDGSTDGTPLIASECGYRPISTPNRGLSSARNTGLQAASGEIVAYLDADARPDRQWLRYLAGALRDPDYAGVGGPNLPPADGWVANCVANAPGGPVHVLLSDREAEHIPGCNMAFRRESLTGIGGFDTCFRVAGDDVDVCWRLQERGERLGFSAGALVWHRARSSVRAYWRQQAGYGRAEALLEEKWPEKYSVGGHYSWGGRLYGTGAPEAPGRRWRVYYGSWGSGLFQRMYEARPPTLGSLPLMPEWSLVVALLVAVSALGLLWGPLLVALPLAVGAVGLTVIQAVGGARRASSRPAREGRRTRSLLLTSLLHMLQPSARLWGRLRSGLTPWRWRGSSRRSLPRPASWTLWSESWLSLESWIGSLERTLRDSGIVTTRGGDFDRWDLELRGGMFGRARLLTTVEEHGHGRQLVRLRFWPRPARTALASQLLLVAAVAFAALGGELVAASVLALALLSVLAFSARDCARAIGSARRAADCLVEATSPEKEAGPEQPPGARPRIRIRRLEGKVGAR